MNFTSPTFLLFVLGSALLFHLFEHPLVRLYLVVLCFFGFFMTVLQGLERSPAQKANRECSQWPGGTATSADYTVTGQGVSFDADTAGVKKVGNVTFSCAEPRRVR